MTPILLLSKIISILFYFTHDYFKSITLTFCYYAKAVMIFVRIPVEGAPAPVAMGQCWLRTKPLAFQVETRHTDRFAFLFAVSN